MRRIPVFIIIFTLAFPVFLKAEEEISLTLEEAIVIALRDNRDILLKDEDIKKAKEKIAEARSDLWPGLSFTGGRTYTRGYYAKDIGVTTTQTTLKQYLYRGGKAVNTIEENRHKLKASEAILNKARIETALDVKKAFYTLLLAGEFINLNKDIMENTKAHLGVVEARYKDGLLSESDALRMKESLSRVREAYEASFNQAESSTAVLRNLLYLDDKVNIKPIGQFIYAPQEIAYDEAFLQAMRRSPQISQYEAQEKADKSAIEAAKADSRPSIYASWDYYSRSTTSLTFSPNKGWQDHNVVGVTLSWPVFDGWAIKAKIEQAIVDLKETQLLREKAIKDTGLELKSAYLDLKNAIAKMASMQAQADLYNDTLLVMQSRHKAGIVSALDLDDAALSCEVALFNQKQAIYDYMLAKARFDKAMGGGLSI